MSGERTGARASRRRRGRTVLAVGVAATAIAVASPADAADRMRSLLAPFGAEAQPAPPWRLALLPAQSRPVTRFALGDEPLDGRPERVLRIEADASYGNLLHPLPAADGVAVAADPHAVLSWHWRVTAPNPAIDLREKRGDDTDLKVCVLFDLPLERVPIGERTLLRLARMRSGESLPAATVCYVTDGRLGAGTVVDNRYSRRVRYLVLRGPQPLSGDWHGESRRLADDFRRLFGEESPTVPPVLAVAVGADADDTRGRSRASIARLALRLSQPRDSAQDLPAPR